MKIRTDFETGDLVFKNKNYTIYLNNKGEGSFSYSIYYRSGRNHGYSSGVIDESEESIDDYLESMHLFSKRIKSGKQARRWLNKELRPLFKKYGYNVDTFYSVLSVGDSWKENFNWDRYPNLLKSIYKKNGFNKMHGEEI
jgi:hypothetical protein